MDAPRVLSAPPSFQRGALGVAIGLAIAEVVLFVSVWRLGVLIDPGGNTSSARTFVVLGTALTLQAMIVVGIAWTLVALSRTKLEWDDHVRLDHPWREWSGDWSDLQRAWWKNGWLALEVAGQWRRWYVRVPDASAPELQGLRAALPSGVWLEGAELRAYYFGRVLPVLLGAIGIGGLIVIAVTAYLRSL
jgi:hypothetical protein